PNSIMRSPIASHLKPPSGRTPQPSAARKMMVRMNPATTAPMDNPALRLGLPSVNRVMAAAASSGRNRMSQGNASRFISKLHCRKVFDVRSLTLPIKRHDQCQPYRNLGGGDRDDKKHEYLAVQVVVEPREGHQSQVG